MCNAPIHQPSIKPGANSPEHIRSLQSIPVNVYWYKEHFSGKALEFLSEVIPLMNIGNHDNSDIQSDYFDVGWYVNVNVGKWDKPYEVVKSFKLEE